MSTSKVLSPITRYRNWVTNHTVAAIVLAGIVSTQIATVVGYWLPAIGLPALDWNRTNGMIYTPDADANLQFLSGGVMHYLDGIAFTVMFAVAIYPYLKWRSSGFGNVLKGLTFGTILAVISLVFMIPLVYYPAANPGFFSLNLGWQLVLAVFVWHWVYGLQLGVLYNPKPEGEEISD